MKKLLFSISLGLAISATSFAQESEPTLIVTLKNGLTAEYRLSRIESLTFGQSSNEAGEPTSGPYSVGDYWSDGTNHGVVVTVDETGENGTIAAMQDAPQDLAWSIVWDITNANDENDGIPNMVTVAAIDPDYTDYPAFKYCADLGEGWYLPAQKELQHLREVLAKTQPTFLSHGGEEINTEAIYWSSTEADQFMDAMAFGADMDFPGMFGIQKDGLCPVRAFRKFGRTSTIGYQVGDLYQQDGVTGIVCEISEDGTHGKIIALKDVAMQGRINAIWDQRANNDNYYQIGASSMTDGEINMQAALANDPTLASLICFRLCADLGEGWYLPAMDEMLSVAANKDMLNTALRANEGSALDSGEYWTSTEGIENPVERAVSVKISDGSTFDYRKYFYLRVRPMKKF